MKNPKYLAWIRRLPCCCCGARPPSEAAHTRDGSEGMGRKSSDLTAIPLCEACHRGRFGYHGFGSEAAWAEYWGLDLDAIRESLWERYERSVNLADSAGKR